MSTIKITTFALFKTKGKPGAPGSTIDPLVAVAARFNEVSGQIELLAGSVPYHADSFKNRAPKPGCGLLMLYGIRDSLEEMHFWRTRARELGAEIATAEFEIDVGTIEVGLTDRDLLKATNGKNRFLNIRRMKKSLQIDVVTKFAEYVVSEGYELEGSMRVSEIATRPDLFDRLFEDDNELSKLDILVIPVADDPEVPGRIRQVAYLRPGARVVSEVHGSAGAKILLPAWMIDSSLAKKMREQTAMQIATA